MVDSFDSKKLLEPLKKKKEVNDSLAKCSAQIKDFFFSI